MKSGYDLDPTRRVCTRCIYDDRVSAIYFDEDGVCNYCRQLDELVDQYGTGQPKGTQEFERILEEIKAAGKGKKYDCIIGVSGARTVHTWYIRQSMNGACAPWPCIMTTRGIPQLRPQNIARVLLPLRCGSLHPCSEQRRSGRYFPILLPGFGCRDRSSHRSGAGRGYVPRGMEIQGELCARGTFLRH